MKQVKSLLALSVLAGGLISASADSTIEAYTATLDVRFATNNIPLFISGISDDMPVTVAGARLDQDLSTDIDGAGKIDGAGWVRVEYSTAVVIVTTNNPGTTNEVVVSVTNSITKAYSDYIVDLSGKLSTKSDKPTAQVTYKGQGYSTAVGTNYTGSFRQYAKTAGSSKMDLKFTGDGTGVLITTNVEYFVTGTSKGSIKPGIDTINNGKTLKIDSSSRLQVGVQRPNSLQFDMVIAGTKINAAGEGMVGSGSLKSDKYNVNLKGLGSLKGSNLKINGTPGNGLIIIAGSTNAIVVGSAEITGKVLGQKLDTTGTTTVR